MNLTKEQYETLHECCGKLEQLDPEVRRLADIARAIGELKDDQLINDYSGKGYGYSGVVFNMARAHYSALNALGIPLEPIRDRLLESHMMTDPNEIIKRCKFLINVAEEFILDLKFALGKE